MRFLHMADIHLGYQQYNSKERFNDFAMAFLHVVEEAVRRRVDFCLLAGDFFEKRTVDPLAMRQAVAGLQRLRDAHIPVIAVEGNHERAHYRDQYSWLEFLDAIGLITLLDPKFKDGQLLLTPYSPEEGGGYVDLPGGVRVYGLKYYGASTDRVLDLFRRSLVELEDRPTYTVLLMHAGLEGILPRCSGAVSHRAMEPLRPWINYVALGHIHKPYEVDGWIYNPGSLETWAMDEVEWRNRGYYLVELAAHSETVHQAQLVPTPRRHFVRLHLSIDDCATPQAVYDAVKARLARQHIPPSLDRPPVVELTLRGTLCFDRLELDLGRIETLVKEACNPLLARVQNATTPVGLEIQAREAMTRAELEHEVLRELIEQDSRYRSAAGEWAQVALELKRRALSGTSPSDILEYLQQMRGEMPMEGQ